MTDLVRTSCALLLATPVLLAAPRQEQPRLVARDGVTEDLLGVAVAVGGTTAVACAPWSDPQGPYSGSAAVFDLRTGTHFATLVPEGGTEFAYFGAAAAIEGTVAVIGAREESFTPGTAYVFDLPGGQQRHALRATDGHPADEFGEAVAISGNLVIVGADRDDENGTRSGSAYLFDVTTGRQLHKLLPADGGTNHFFGYSVAIEGTTALVGASLADGVGAAYLFDATTGAELHKLQPAELLRWDDFGRSVAMDNGRAVVGAPFTDGAGASLGSVYVFDSTTGQQLTRLLPSDGDPGYRFGTSLALRGDLLAVTSTSSFGSDLPGRVYLFDLSTFREVRRLRPTGADGITASNRFGSSVALGDDVVLAGAPWAETGGGAAAGTVHVFHDGPGTSTCFGGTGCPCGNRDSSAGCAASTGRGMLLHGKGSVGVAADDLVLSVTGLPSPQAHGRFLMGRTLVPPFAAPGVDGLTCIGATFGYPPLTDDGTPPHRLRQRGLVMLAAAGGVTIAPGETWHFQAWTRDAHGSPCGGGSNLSNAYSVTFGP